RQCFLFFVTKSQNLVMNLKNKIDRNKGGDYMATREVKKMKVKVVKEEKNGGLICLGTRLLGLVC
ncbi:hypothetical protein, partial [Anoxybacillus sp. TBDG-1]